MRKVLLLALALLASAAEDGGSRYVDKPTQVTGEEQRVRLEKAIAPLVARARETFPAVRQRYLAGLPEGCRLFVTCKLVDGASYEIVFLRVERIAAGEIGARIASDLLTLRNYRTGQAVAVKEAEILDWTIVDKAGEEEGNIVGKFLDTYKP